MATPYNQLGTTQEVLTPADLNGVATEAKQDAAKAVIDATKVVVDDTNARVKTIERRMSPIGPCRYCVANGGTLRWRDPGDTTLPGGIVWAKWARTVIVRRDDGEYPTSPTDGVVVATSTVRNQYFETPLVDSGYTSTSKYRAFPFSTEGYCNEEDSNDFTAAWILGFEIDTSDSDPETCVTYIEDNAEFSPVRMDFALDVCNLGSWRPFIEENFAPAMLTYGGEIDELLDPDNLTLTKDGNASKVADLNFNGNAMLIVKPLFWNIVEADGIVTVRVSNVKRGDDWFNWTHLMHDGGISPFCAWPLFEGAVSSGKMRSIATGAVPTGNLTQTAELQNAQANGANWYTTTVADEMAIKLLFVLLTKTLDSNAAIGQTYVSRALALQIACGSQTDKGWFYGRHFDGTNNVQVGTKFLCMENMWAHRLCRAVGVVLQNGNWLTKMTPSRIDGSASDVFLTTSDTAPYTQAYVQSGNISTGLTSGASITRMNFGSRGAMLPRTASGGSTATYYCDNAWTTTDLLCPRFGGNLTTGLTGGVFSCSALNAPSSAYWNTGASLSYHAF